VKKTTLVLLGLGLAVTAACTVPETNDALPKGSDQFPTEQKGSVATTATTVAVEAAVEAASSCDVVREALLTGTPAEINASMKALMADKTADATAREYADYYLNRDKAEPDMQKMDVSLIRMSCSI
jgi:hypothetical protein